MSGLGPALALWGKGPKWLSGDTRYSGKKWARRHAHQSRSSSSPRNRDRTGAHVTPSGRVRAACGAGRAIYGGCADRIRSQAWDPSSQKRPPEPLSCGSQAIEMYRRGDPFQPPPIRLRTTIKSRHAHCQRLKTGIVIASRIRSNSNLPSTGSFSTPAIPGVSDD